MPRSVVCVTMKTQQQRSRGKIVIACEPPPLSFPIMLMASPFPYLSISERIAIFLGIAVSAPTSDTYSSNSMFQFQISTCLPTNRNFNFTLPRYVPFHRRKWAWPMAFLWVKVVCNIKYFRFSSYIRFYYNAYS